MAGVPLKLKSVALDTNVLLDLAGESPQAIAALAAIRRRLKGAIIITPTVIQELGWLADNGDTEEARNLAILAARDLRARWGIVPANCDPEWHGVIDLAAQELRNRNLLPEEEVNDSLIICESALAQCALLVSSDGHMANIDNTTLNEVLVRRDLGAIVILQPWRIVKDYA